jgi:hypothetical protein
LPANPGGYATWNYVDLTTGHLDTYDAATGLLRSSEPILGGPFADYGPDRWDYEQATRPDRIRRNILANLPPGRPGRFQKAPPAATGDTTPTNTP